jgi:hypothetical protein
VKGVFTSRERRFPVTRDLLAAHHSPLPQGPATSSRAAPTPVEPRASQGWHWLEAENRRLEALDVSGFDFALDLPALLAPLAVVVLAATLALTAWLMVGG